MSIIIMPYEDSWHIWCLYDDGRATVVSTVNTEAILNEIKSLLKQHKFPGL